MYTFIKIFICMVNKSCNYKINNKMLILSNRKLYIRELLSIS